MRSETQPKATGTALDNELDLRGLFCALWRGKGWIIGAALVFAVIALVYSYLVKQEWTAAAITDKPTVNMLGSYFSQQQFLRNLDVKNTALPTSDMPGIGDEAYQEFIRQLSSYDTRRDFWQASDYFISRKQVDAHADAVLLDEMIGNIQFTPGDEAKKLPDQVTLTAETAADANALLRRYVAFASQRAAGHLNEDITGAWTARTISLKAQVKRQEAVANTIHERDLSALRHALDIAKRQGISHSQVNVPEEQLPQSGLFLLGEPVLQARLEALQAAGPGFDVEYDQNRAMLATLSVGPTLQNTFQTYRYLRTPEEPVKRDKPRRIFLLILWGALGGLIGAGVALARRR
ncbi:ECA polysaccharide chain length modulation protein [Acerihabitans arboris]|uniref:ECA polysaccharide chain length modulation protein n=1 Tax=Acerihabitans arboris TaxID=2691583 RepID=A0A845SGY0_9GAMM|nr:ECA polysaccharide chain length modulation protein [Acerihabitans arboris]NDL64363.1 ECA polysaccharide chain length modulation protein [Acerihabitans arboris]